MGRGACQPPCTRRTVHLGRRVVYLSFSSPHLTLTLIFYSAFSVCSSPNVNTAWAKPLFTLMSHHMVFQNSLKANRNSLPIASQKSYPIWVCFSDRRRCSLICVPVLVCCLSRTLGKRSLNALPLLWQLPSVPVAISCDLRLLSQQAPVTFSL